MKKFSTLFLLLINFLAYSQESKNVQSNLNIGVYVKQDKTLDQSGEARNQLEAKLISLCANNGITVQPGMSNPLVIGVRINNVEHRSVESGLTSQVVGMYDVTLVSTNIKTGELFSTVTTRVSGMGKNYEEALKRCVNSININDAKYTGFLAESKVKIIDYYNSQCSNIMLQAKNKGASQNFEEAFNYYLSIPQGSNCFSEAQNELTKQYLNYIEFKCSSEIVKAKSAIANNDFDLGLSILSRIYGSQKCNKEVSELLDKISKEADEQLKLKWDYLFNQQGNEYKLAQARIEASRAIVFAYYSNFNNVYKYDLIHWNN